MIKKRIYSFAAALVIAASAITIPAVQNNSGAVQPVSVTTAYALSDYNIKDKSVEDLECFRVVNDMGAGINLGNTFDAVDDNAVPGDANMYLESAWVQDVKTTKEMIDTIKASGFKTIRIPVSWNDHVDADFNINSEWLNRVQEVVDYAIDDDMYVIINIHHDNEYDYMFPKYEYLDNSKKYVNAIWSQVAEKFSDYDEHLVFETLNEPRVKGSNYEWWYTSSSDECREAQDCINQYNQTAVDAIRKAGGKNDRRYIMVPAYCAKSQSAITNDFKLPKDTVKNRLILSVHEYIPYNFAMSGPDDNGSVTNFAAEGDDGAEISNLMDTLYVCFIQKGVPVIIGEFGARNKNENTEDRENYASYYYDAARARGITCCWWDNYTFDTYAGEAFGLLDRSENTMKYEGIAEAAATFGQERDDIKDPEYPDPVAKTDDDDNDSKNDDITILPDGTILLPREIGDSITLDVSKSDDCAGGGGCLEFTIVYNGVNYWVAYAWNYDESGKFTIDMNTPTKVVDTTRQDSNGDSIVVEDQSIIDGIAALAKKSTSTKIQYWWACDLNWNNYDSAAGHISVDKITLNGGGSSSSDEENSGTILPDGTILFKKQIGKAITLDISKTDDCAGGGGCLEFTIVYNGVNYWVAYAWNYDESGKFKVDMTTPTKVVDTTRQDANGDSVVIEDQSIIDAIAKLAQQSESTKIQYWWACDLNWNNYDSATGYLKVNSAVLDGGNSEGPAETTVTTETEPYETSATSSESASETKSSETSEPDSTETSINLPAATVLGDVTDDGTVDVRDVTALNQYIVKLSTLNEQQLANSDVISDGKIDLKDLGQIKKYLIKVISKF